MTVEWGYCGSDRLITTPCEGWTCGWNSRMKWSCNTCPLPLRLSLRTLLCRSVATVVHYLFGNTNGLKKCKWLCSEQRSAELLQMQIVTSRQKYCRYYNHFGWTPKEIAILSKNIITKTSFTKLSQRQMDLCIWNVQVLYIYLIDLTF